jgi:hypothetical protein
LQNVDLQKRSQSKDSQLAAEALIWFSGLPAWNQLWGFEKAYGLYWIIR